MRLFIISQSLSCCSVIVLSFVFEIFTSDSKTLHRALELSNFRRVSSNACLSVEFSLLRASKRLSVLDFGKLDSDAGLKSMEKL